MHDTERKITQLKNKFKDLFYNSKEIKDLSVKIKPITEQLTKQTEANDRSSLLLTQQKVSHVTVHGQNEIEMDSKEIEQLEREDPSTETLALTNRWEELVKPKYYKLTNGIWKYNTPRFH